ncbi:MAG: hypothetical protein ACD_73C00731G0002 [uncultured bacterium]|nr:MAG: hypothetical protein ACD_73C00731G0002 [uncultured bacterium]
MSFSTKTVFTVRVRTITIPTYITLIRFVLIPFFVNLFLNGSYKLALILFVLAGITDFLDGYLARTLNQRSSLGSMLDPLADKFLMLFSFILLSSRGYIPDIVTYFVIGRDLFILLGIGLLWAFKIKLYYKPTILSKIGTTFQILLLCHTFLFVYISHNDYQILQNIRFLFQAAIKTPFYIIVMGLTLITWGQYAYIGYKFWRYGERGIRLSASNNTTHH